MGVDRSMISSKLQAKEKIRRKQWDDLCKRKRDERGEISRKSSPRVPRRSYTADKLKCIHREEFIRFLPCKSCCGSVKIKIYGCPIHGECSFYEKSGRGIKYCLGCDQRDAGELPTSPRV